jgi:hypothetical protein
MTAPGPTFKVCDKCGFKSSVAKKYCDHCGAAMVVVIAEDIPHTAIRQIQPETAESAPPPMTKSASWTVMRRRDSLHNTGYIFAITLLAAVGIYRYSVHMKPVNAVPRLAAEYLQALQSNDLGKAYDMFSSMAKANCSLEEFKAARNPTPWVWSDIKAVRIEPEAAVVGYKLSVEGRPPAKDFLHFIREEGGWARPYNWTLLQKAEAALERSDVDMALLLSQAAVAVNPRDPMARGYLCEAVFYRRVPQETERECAKAIELSRTYPSKLSMKSLSHLHSILGDTYKDSLRRYPEAVEQYNTVLSFPDLPPTDRCRLLLARAGAQAAHGRAEQSASDLRTASGLCTDPADIEYINRELAPR